MKPAGPKGAFADFEEGSPAYGVLDADLDGLDGEHGPGGHASADKLPDADFFNAFEDVCDEDDIAKPVKAPAQPAQPAQASQQQTK